MEARYLVSEGWMHLFTADPKKETETRFVYDSESGRLVVGEAKWNANGGWTTLTAEELADLDDSITDANAQCLEKPEEWDLLPSDTLPEWAEPAPSPAP